MTTSKPYLCGNYSQLDWDILNGIKLDADLYEYADEYLDPLERGAALLQATKPIWA